MASRLHSVVQAAEVLVLALAPSSSNSKVNLAHSSANMKPLLIPVVMGELC